MLFKEYILYLYSNCYFANVLQCNIPLFQSCQPLMIKNRVFLSHKGGGGQASLSFAPHFSLLSLRLLSVPDLKLNFDFAVFSLTKIQNRGTSGPLYKSSFEIKSLSVGHSLLPW